MIVSKKELKALLKVLDSGNNSRNKGSVITSTIFYSPKQQMLFANSGYIMGIISHKTDFTLKDLEFIPLDMEKAQEASVFSDKKEWATPDGINIEKLLASKQGMEKVSETVSKTVCSLLGKINKKTAPSYFQGISFYVNYLTDAMNFIKDATESTKRFQAAPVFNMFQMPSGNALSAYTFTPIKCVFVVVASATTTTSKRAYYDNETHNVEYLYYGK